MKTLQKNSIFQILSKRYSEDFFRQNAKVLREDLDREGIIVLRNFLSEKSVQKLQEEAGLLKPNAFRSTSAYNLYVLPPDPNFPEASARNRKFSTTKKCIPDDQIPETSILRTIYDSDDFRKLLCTMLNVPALYPYADTLSSININYYDPGDALEWHFDNADFAITLLGKKCKKGGDYEYFTDIRYTNKGEEDYERARQAIDGEIEPKRSSLNDGDLMIFRGNRSLHRVTKVEEGERILITFNLNTKPGVSLSEKSRQTFFGRIA